jgi:hypothetical protein
MTISVFPIYHKQSALMRSRLQQGRIARRSGSPSPYAPPYIAEQDELSFDQNTIALRITPIYPAHLQHRDQLPRLSFSAQLLELGLKHNVDGLIQKAHEQLGYAGAEQSSPQHKATHNYERAQDNFARNHLNLVERNF